MLFRLGLVVAIWLFPGDVVSPRATAVRVDGGRKRQGVACPAGALAVARALLTADTLGVGIASASLDSSRIDTLMTHQYEGAPDMSYVVTAITLSCQLSQPDSVIFREETQLVGKITSTETSYGMVFVPDTATSVGQLDLVTRSGQWKVLGPYAAVLMSPAAALRRFDLPAESRRALERLLHRGKP